MVTQVTEHNSVTVIESDSPYAGWGFCASRIQLWAIEDWIPEQASIVETEARI